MISKFSCNFLFLNQLNMQSHCPWVHNCVGANNHRQFYLYISSGVIGILLFVRLTIACEFPLTSEEDVIRLTPLRSPGPASSSEYRVQFALRGTVQPGSPRPFHGSVRDMVYDSAHLDGHALRCPIDANSTGNDDV